MSLFTKLPIVVNNPLLGVIPAADTDNLAGPEASAYGHWIFDTGDSTAYASKVSSKVLTEQNSAPSFSSNYVTITGAPGDSLLTDYPDSANAVDTIAMIVRLPTIGGIRLLGGTLLANPNGGGLFLSGTSMYHQYRNAITSAEVDDGFAADNWYFLAATRDFSGGTNVLRVLLGGDDVHTGTHFSDYNPNATDNINFPNAGYAAVITGDIDYAEFMVFDYAMDASALTALYNRRKEFMGTQGITVV